MSALDTASWPLGTAANEAIRLIETRVPAISVSSIMPNERYGADGVLRPVMDVGFTIPPQQSIFYVHPRSDKDWTHLALHSISLRANVVLSIYQGLQERADIIPLIDPLASDYGFDAGGGGGPPPKAV